MRLFILLVFTLSPLALSSTQKASPAPPSVEEPRQLGDRAMRFLAKNDIKGMFAFIHTLMPLDKEELDKILDTSITQRKTLGATLGAYAGYALISECRKSDFLARLTFVEKRTRNFIRWEFVFYKPKDRWQISAFYWDTKHAEVFAPC